MTATDRLAAEQAFHDRQAGERCPAFPDAAALRFADDAYLDHETWIRPAIDRLGPLDGLRVLDYGCGHGMAAVVLARRGGRVTAFDLSPGYLAEARRRAEANGADVHFLQADGERLPFADGSFDRIWGNAVLHHLDLGKAVPRAASRPGAGRPGGLLRTVGRKPLVVVGAAPAALPRQGTHAGRKPAAPAPSADPARDLPSHGGRRLSTPVDGPPRAAAGTDHRRPRMVRRPAAAPRAVPPPILPLCGSHLAAVGL